MGPLDYNLRALASVSNEAFIVVRLDRTIVLWSRGAEAIFGYSAEEVLGEISDFLVPQAHLSDVEVRMTQVARGQVVAPYQVPRVTKSGTTAWIEISLTPLSDEDGQVTGALAIARDITSRKETEDVLQSRLRQQATVAQLGQLALGGMDQTLLINEAVRRVAGALDVELCKILELLPDGRSLLLSAGTGWHDGLVGQAIFDAEAGSQGGYTLQSSKPIIVEDLESEMRFERPKLLLEHGVVSGMTVIINGFTQTFGVLGVHTTRQRTFTEDDIHFLQAVANVLGEAIQHRQAQEDHDGRVRAEDAVMRMQVEAHQHSLVLETANRVALDVLSNRAGVEALRHIAEAARILAGARYAALGVATPDGTKLQEFLVVGMTHEEQLAIGPPPEGKGILGVLLECKKPLRIDNLSHHPSSHGFPPNHPPMDTFLGVPIRRGETVLGSLYLTNKQGGAFTDADESAVSALAAHAAIAIHNLHMLSRQQALVQSLLSAQEEERRNIAHDLHDGLTQFVMASHAHLGAFQRLQERGLIDKAQSELQQGIKHLKEAVLESRRLVSGLRTLVLDDLGLESALEQLLAETKVQAGWLETSLECNLSGERFDPSLETTVYRVVQEALSNIRKHAMTQRVRVHLTREVEPTLGETLLLKVQDWGKGFDPKSAYSQTGHFGLHGMTERVHLLGGSLKVYSESQKGTLIEARIAILKSAAKSGLPADVAPEQGIEAKAS